MFRQTVSSSLTRSNMKWTAGSHASGSGSGKSTFTNRIKAYFGDDVAVLYHDNYYRCQDGVPFEQRVTVNYVEADSDERILRRISRDVSERGRDLNGIIEQYLTTVKPMHYLYVEPTRSKADVVINSGKNDVEFDLFVSKIGQLLEEREKEN